jgi:hypothetical protein
VGADPATVDISVEASRVALRFAGTPYEDDSTDLGEGVLAQLETLRRENGPAAYGAQLVQSIVRGDVAAGFQEAMSTIKGGKQSLRLRLHIGEDARLGGIWWEGLFDKTIPGGWASINRGTPVSRYQHLDPEWTQGPVRSSRLKVLAVISNPRDLAQPGPWEHIPPLDEREEARTLETALTDLEGVTYLAQPASPYEISSALMDGPKGLDSPGYHVLHLVAPAFIDPADGRAFLLLEEKDESARRLYEEGLLKLVSRMPDLQLVVLPGAHSVPAADGAALVRLASRLVESGVPAALALRDRLPSDPAATFWTRLYTLVEKSRRKTDWIDSVVTDARTGLQWDVGEERWAWLLPVLYMVEQLFRKQQVRTSNLRVGSSSLSRSESPV